MKLTKERNGMLIVAIEAGNNSEMDVIAGKGKRAVLAQAAKHRQTGDYMSRVKTATVPGRSGNGRRVNDRVVYSDDPAAYVIEYGRIRINRVSATRVQATRRGQHIFSRAWASL